ncbi:hypothetical protein D3C86_1371670 [compost metagenome]
MGAVCVLANAHSEQMDSSSGSSHRFSLIPFSSYRFARPGLDSRAPIALARDKSIREMSQAHKEGLGA